MKSASPRIADLSKAHRQTFLTLALSDSSPLRIFALSEFPLLNSTPLPTPCLSLSVGIAKSSWVAALAVPEGPRRDAAVQALDPAQRQRYDKGASTSFTDADRLLLAQGSVSGRVLSDLLALVDVRLVSSHSLQSSSSAHEAAWSPVFAPITGRSSLLQRVQ